MIDLVPSELAQLPPATLYGLALAAVLALCIVVLFAVEGVYLAALVVHLMRSAAERVPRPPTALGLLGLLLAATAPPLTAQEGGSVRSIEPRYTRIFGADSMEMYQAAMSPDGRWVAFARMEAPEAQTLWIVAAAGGEPMRLTSGRYNDDTPVWFPASDRILFRSDRTNSLMTIPVDPRTGRPSGPPRQVSLDRVWGHTLSPNGEAIAYYTRRDSTHRIVVIPANGGLSRVVVEYGGSVAALGTPYWTSEGDWIYYTVRPPGRLERTLYRVRAQGGVPEERVTIRSWDARVSPDGRYLLIRLEQGPGPEFTWEVATTEGRPLARFTLRSNSMPGRFTPDGRGILVSQSNMVAPIRVVPVAGGPMRQLTEAREYDWPLGWTADGARAVLQTQADGRQVILAVPIAGGPATQWTIPDEARRPITLSRDGRYLRYAVGDDPSSRTARIRRLADGQTRTVSEPTLFFVQPPPIGAGGGFWTSPDGFLHLARRGDRLEVWITPSEGAPRLLRSFPFAYAGRTNFGVYGDRIAYRERRGDSTALFVVEGRNGPARQLATVPGDANSPTWSHSGRRIAWEYYPPGDDPSMAVVLVELGPSGAPAGPPRILDAGPKWGWQIEWLPNDDAFTVFGMTGAGSETHVYLVSLREGERPVALTRDDPSVRWGYELSPDGRHVAYPAEISRGSSIWRVDLSEVLASTNRRGTDR